jgi:nucleotide-binding universal stress UspA family protein
MDGRRCDPCPDSNHEKSFACWDLSAASRLVLCWARLFAEGFASRIEVLHVSEPPQFLIEGQEQAQLELTKTELSAAVRDLAREVLGNQVPYHIVVEEGHPVQVVMQRLERHTPDLIAMGSHGHDGKARVLMGSVAGERGACGTVSDVDRQGSGTS